MACEEVTFFGGLVTARGRTKTEARRSADSVAERVLRDCAPVVQCTGGYVAMAWAEFSTKDNWSEAGARWAWNIRYADGAVLASGSFGHVYNRYPNRETEGRARVEEQLEVEVKGLLAREAKRFNAATLPPLKPHGPKSDQQEFTMYLHVRVTSEPKWDGQPSSDYGLTLRQASEEAERAVCGAFRTMRSDGPDTSDPMIDVEVSGYAILDVPGQMMLSQPEPMKQAS